MRKRPRKYIFDYVKGKKYSHNLIFKFSGCEVEGLRILLCKLKAIPMKSHVSLVRVGL